MTTSLILEIVIFNLLFNVRIHGISARKSVMISDELRKNVLGAVPKKALENLLPH